MQSSPEILGLPSELRTTLARLMPDAEFSEEELQEQCLPVVMMLREHAVMAFAVGDQAEYQKLYDAFKKHYLKNTVKWSTKDISFVYCLPAEITVDPDFYSRVEVDVYFCRKYVVRLGGSLSDSLARLPFLPLSPVSHGAQIRPPSAQTLLRQRNLKAELAKGLVVPATSSATKILSDCLDGAFGPPDALQLSAAPIANAVVAEDRVQSILKSISIQNFRAYRTKKEFKLGAAVTVLYGPNGFGKTSFFDALDFVVTGGVGRLPKALGGFAKVAKHLDSEGEPTEVSLTFEREGKTHVITRKLEDVNNALVNGKSTPRKEVLSLLTGGAAPGADRVDSLVDLFRATHLFSQENQELTKDVATKCELSSDLVARMLAFEDYASGLKKADEVIKLATTEHIKTSERIASAQHAIAVERQELERLEKLATSNASSVVLDARFAEIEALIAAAGFDISHIASRDTRSLRAMLEGAASRAVSENATLERAIEQIEMLSSLRTQSANLNAQLFERRALMQKTATQEHETLERYNLLESKLARLKAEERSHSSRLEWLNWAVSAQPEYEQLTTKVQSLAAEMEALLAQIVGHREALTKAQADQREATAVLQNSDAGLKAASDKRARFQLVKDAFEAWTLAAPALPGLHDAESLLRASIDQTNGLINESVRADIPLELSLAEAEAALANARTRESRQKQLITELRGLVDGPNCQLCGHNHGSTEELLSAIDRRMDEGDQIIQLMALVSTQREAIQTHREQRHNLKAKLKNDEVQLSQIQNHRQQLESQRADCEASLLTYGLSLTSETQMQLQNIYNQVLGAELHAVAAVESARQLCAAVESALVSAQATYQSIESQRQDTESVRKAALERLTALLHDANRGAVDFAGGLQPLVDAKSECDLQRSLASATVQETASQVSQQKAIHAAEKAEALSALANVQQLDQDVAEHQARIQSVLAALSAANFGEDVSPDQLRQQVDANAAFEVSVLKLRDRVAELEVAVDTAATSAAFDNIRKNIQANESLVQEETARAQKVQPWISYFTEVKKLLSTQQSYATNHFIKEYGPRTAVIQQRLRPVYGFGEIDVTSKDSAISIRIRRKDDSLRPTDFFSQSQVQTLVLGLFLTACSSQTWSGFSSIMMDDPVTHFDDLNTYALLDLILGLQSSSEGQRQFVISTCDEKLLQLARHKFRHLGEDAKFYRFQAIGADGPMVSELSA
ncbi:hypothetical protein E2K99_23375 [Herbaspirillum huttiense]|uniref:AAA family ATPase n=1 Tax=Herbaspirillum huttiense TaxID=863372 RepID=UPI001064EACB|nr:AAA family ATPase [Herbaspirillum huttiense]QBP77741.1 hypothetical protein E2K99_23375 [Herbaspirillum huttiense]